MTIHDDFQRPEFGPAGNIVTEAMHDRFPDYSLGDRIRELFNTDPNLDRATSLQEVINAVNASSDEELPNKHNYGITTISALSATLAMLRPHETGKIASQIDQIRAVAGNDIYKTIVTRFYGEKKIEDKTIGISLILRGPDDLLKDLLRCNLGQSTAEVESDLSNLYSTLDRNDPRRSDIARYLSWLATTTWKIRNAEQLRQRAERKKQIKEENKAHFDKVFENAEDFENPDEFYEKVTGMLGDEQFTSEIDINTILDRLYVRYLSRFADSNFNISSWKHLEDAIALARSKHAREADRLSGSDTSPLSYWFDNKLLRIIFPDTHSVRQFALENPAILKQTAFFEDWHNAIADQKLKKRLEERRGFAEKAPDLQKYGIEKLRVWIPRLGVPYTSPEELLNDIYTYFVANRADTFSHNDLMKKSTTLDDQTGNTARKISLLSRSNAQIYTEDIELPFREFLINLPAMAAGEKATFQTGETRRGGTPYKLEITSFADHAISINIAAEKNGSPTYYLMIEGGGHSPDNQGLLLERFAAFFDRHIEYGLKPEITVDIIPSLPDGFEYSKWDNPIIEDWEVAYSYFNNPNREEKTLQNATPHFGNETVVSTNLRQSPFHGLSQVLAELIGSNATLFPNDKSTDLNSSEVWVSRRLIKLEEGEIGPNKEFITVRQANPDPDLIGNINRAYATLVEFDEDLSREDVEKLLALNTTARE